MAYLMKFKRKVASIVGEEKDKINPEDPTKRYFAKGQVYAIQPNDAVHFIQSDLAEFVPNPKRKR